MGQAEPGGTGLSVTWGTTWEMDREALEMSTRGVLPEILGLRCGGRKRRGTFPASQRRPMHLTVRPPLEARVPGGRAAGLSRASLCFWPPLPGPLCQLLF